MSDLSKFSKAELTDGPSGSVKLVGMPEPTGNEQVSAVAGSGDHAMTGPGGATEIKVGGSPVTGAEFTRPGGNTDI